jgi:hypothetical protein
MTTTHPEPEDRVAISFLHKIWQIFKLSEFAQNLHPIFQTLLFRSKPTRHGLTESSFAVTASIFATSRSAAHRLHDSSGVEVATATEVAQKTTMESANRNAKAAKSSILAAADCVAASETISRRR